MCEIQSQSDLSHALYSTIWFVYVIGERKTDNIKQDPLVLADDTWEWNFY